MSGTNTRNMARRPARKTASRPRPLPRTTCQTEPGSPCAITGLPVLGDGGPLQVPPNPVASIGADGTVNAKCSDGKMVAMISAARQFEAQMKVLQAAEANKKAAAQLLPAN